MRNVYVPYRTPLNSKMLSAAFNIVDDNPACADFAICGKVVPGGVDPTRCILIQTEPPLTGDRRVLYKTFAKYHTVICFHPRGPNQFPFVPPGGNPALYPYSPGLVYDRRRRSTALTTRGVYYAGRRYDAMALVPDCYHSINLYGVRHDVCRHLMKNYPETTVLGQGWPKSSKKPGQRTHWREQKQRDIAYYRADFVLCMENSMLPGYISEKIHDGFSSDRVTLYLGEPNIENYVPPETFFCLNEMLDKKTKRFDFKALCTLMRTVKQPQCDAKIKAARKWRKSIVGRHEKLRDRMTEFVIARGKRI
jgi:hypothetical protein